MKRGDGFGCDPAIVAFVLILASAVAAAFNSTGTILLTATP
jgi:hypothetical protein